MTLDGALSHLTILKLLNLTEMREINKEDLIDAYAQQLLDSMDMKTMERFVYDTLVENLTNYTEEELITEVTDHYPELLDDSYICPT